MNHPYAPTLGYFEHKLPFNCLSWTAFFSIAFPLTLFSISNTRETSSKAGNVISITGDSISKAGNTKSGTGNANSKAGNINSITGNTISKAGDSKSKAGNTTSGTGAGKSKAGNARAGIRFCLAETMARLAPVQAA